MYSLQGTAGHVGSQKTFHAIKEPPLFFVMMRFNVKIALLLVTLIGFFTMFVLWSLCGSEHGAEWHKTGRHYNDRTSEQPNGDEIDCDINGEYTIACRKDGDEVYLPFTFIRKYFEIYGKLTNNEGLERFEWSHSYSKIYHPKGKYDPRGVFMNFENYNVEVRDRVKCVSATEGVPVSTQWESQGYYYPTQIAQFGLSHYSKNLTEPEPRRKTLEDADKDLARWITPPNGNLERIYDATAGSLILKYKSGESYSDAIRLKLDHVMDFVMGVDLLLNGNSSLDLTLQNRETKDIYNLHYITSDTLITAQDNHIYHGIAMGQTWKRLTRDLIIDLHKGINYLNKDKIRHKIPRSKLKIIGIALHGEGSLDNLTLSTSEHIRQFYDAADWFLEHQNRKTGGWEIPVRRKLGSGFHDLSAGWYSAMGQGHGISVLARAYHHSNGDRKYLMAAVDALKPFRVSSNEGGVLAVFMDKYKWYEEYPTEPASFVLNGFIYSLLGLYDLMVVAPKGDGSEEAEQLFNDGIISLKNMLLFYDMGSVTSYDLRHISLRMAPNLARWDYHATHINQLLLLGLIDQDPLFKQTAERWIGYMYGKRAAHN